MDRQQTQLQLQANTWLEKQKVGLTASQKQAFIQWLNTSKAHQTAYQESMQIERLLTQFSEHEMNETYIFTGKYNRDSNDCTLAEEPGYELEFCGMGFNRNCKK